MQRCGPSWLGGSSQKCQCLNVASYPASLLKFQHGGPGVGRLSVDAMPPVYHDRLYEGQGGMDGIVWPDLWLSADSGLPERARVLEESVSGGPTTPQ